MKIRVINEEDWERTYDFDKSIIRVGSQISCDIQLKGNDIQPIHIQLVRANGKEGIYVMRLFADNITITRGNQNFQGMQMVPYDVLDGDKISFSSFRLIIGVDENQERVRTTRHMEAKMYLQKRELDLESPINGVLKLRNIGTEKACQFRMHISGIPDECLKSAPLPYLYPGGVSTVGFMITHLQTKPLPGFHTVSISLSAPDDYYGETLEFNQDIYVNPVFRNEITLEDDSGKLAGFNKTMNDAEKTEEKAVPVVVQETARMIPGQAEIEKTEPEPNLADIPIVLSAENTQNAFNDGETEEDRGSDDNRRQRRKTKKQRVLVISHEDEGKTAFEDGGSPEDSVQNAEKTEQTPSDSSPIAEETHSVESSVSERAAKQVPADEPVIEADQKDSAEKADASKNHAEPEQMDDQSGSEVRSEQLPDESPAEAEQKQSAETTVAESGGSSEIPELAAEEIHNEALPDVVTAEPEAVNETSEIIDTMDRLSGAEDMYETNYGQYLDKPSDEPGNDPAEKAEPESAADEEPAEDSENPSAADIISDVEVPPDAEPEAPEEDLLQESIDLLNSAIPLEENNDAAEEKPEETGAAPDDGQTTGVEEDDVVIKKDGEENVSIPVVRSNQFTDFDSAENAPETMPEEKPVVRFVKGDKFDD